MKQNGKTSIKVYAVIIFLMGLMHSSFCLAAVVKHLYSASIPVAAEVEPLNPSDLLAVYQQTLIKVSGHSDIVNNRNIQSSFTNVSNYLQQYAYSIHTQADQSQQHLLNASFEHKAIDQLLHENGFPVWGEHRPLVLFWIVNTNPSAQNTMLNSGDEGPMTEMLYQEANARGLPIVLPILDLEDMQKVSAADVLDNNFTTILQAATRYHSNAIVIGQVTDQSGKAEAKLTVLNNDQQIPYQFSADNMTLLLQSAVDKVADTLASSYTVSGTNSYNATITLTIGNVTDVRQYAKVTRYLQQITPVRSVSLTQLAPNQLVYQLQVVGSLQDLQRAINLDHHMQAMPNVAGENNQRTGLYYQWLS